MSREVSVMAIWANMYLENQGLNARLEYAEDGTLQVYCRDFQGLRRLMRADEPGYGEAHEAMMLVEQHCWYPAVEPMACAMH